MDKTNEPKSVREFNVKVAKLIKEMSPEDIVEVLSSQSSLISRTPDVNIHRVVSPEGKTQVS